MKYATFTALIVFGLSGLLFGQETSLEDAVKYLEENGYEYEIAYDEAVKELPEGAVVFTPFGIEALKKEVLKEAEIMATARQTENVIMLGPISYVQDYVYGDIPNQRAKMTGGYVFSGIGNVVGYKFKWERNTTANQGAPGWTGITRSDACTYSGYSAPACSCSGTTPNVECYFSSSSGGQQLSNWVSRNTACGQCSGSPYVFSVLFSANPRTLTYVPGIGGTWIPIYLYLGWVETLSDGDPEPFDPEWNLCNTNLISLCNW